MSERVGNPYAPCPCGSGQKFKFCCMKKVRERQRELARETAARMGPDGEFDRLLERAVPLLNSGRGREAAEILEKLRRMAPMVPQTYNNLALAHFVEGDVEKAIELAEEVDRVVDPGNVFALGNLIHFHLMLGKTAEAHALTNRMRTLSGRDEFAYFKKCEAFARLRLHEDVLATALRGIPRAQECRDALAFFAGVAAANLGRYAEAEKYLRGIEDEAHVARAQRYLDLLERRKSPATLDGDWPYLEVHHWAPAGFLERCKKEDEARRWPGLVEALVCVLNDTNGDEHAAIETLRWLKTPGSIAVLRRIAFGTFGSNDTRMKAVLSLREAGAISDGEPVKIWHNGEWRSVSVHQEEVGGAPQPQFPEELRERMGEMLAAIKGKEFEKAEKLGRALFEKAPDSPQILHNLAQSLRGLGKRDESAALLRRAMEVDPTYLYAPASLALMLIEDGQVEEARESLKKVRTPTPSNLDGFALFSVAQARVAFLEGDYLGAAQVWEVAEKVAPDAPVLRDAREAWGYRLFKFLASMKERAIRRREAQRLRLLDPHPDAWNCLGTLTREQLYAMARAHGISGISALKKDHLRFRLTGHLANGEIVRSARSMLSSEAREAFDAVLGQGGVMPFDEFTKKWPTRAEDLSGWVWKSPETVLGKLALLGFLFEGSVGARPSVVIPREVREAMSTVSGQPR